MPSFGGPVPALVAQLNVEFTSRNPPASGQLLSMIEQDKLGLITFSFHLSPCVIA
jgi:hypothetical protein